jgi:hypothetical protein
MSATLASIRMMFTERPDILIVNGPGTLQNFSKFPSGASTCRVFLRKVHVCRYVYRPFSSMLPWAGKQRLDRPPWNSSAFIFLTPFLNALQKDHLY